MVRYKGGLVPLDDHTFENVGSTYEIINGSHINSNSLIIKRYEISYVWIYSLF